MGFKCFLAILSVSGSQPPCLDMQNRGSFSEPGKMASIFLRADIGHNTDSGMVIC